jgi:hypothetical protein
MYGQPTQIVATLVAADGTPLGGEEHIVYSASGGNLAAATTPQGFLLLWSTWNAQLLRVVSMAMPVGADFKPAGPPVELPVQVWRLACNSTRCAAAGGFFSAQLGVAAIAAVTELSIEETAQQMASFAGKKKRRKISEINCSREVQYIPAGKHISPLPFGLRSFL